MRGVAAQALLHCELVPGRQAALPDQTLIGFDTASRRQEEAFLLLFFPISKKKKKPLFVRNAPPLLSPLTPPGSVVLLALLLSLFLFSFLRLPHFFLFLFVFFILRLKPMDFCFFCLSLLCSSHLVVDQ